MRGRSACCCPAAPCPGPCSRISTCCSCAPAGFMRVLKNIVHKLQNLWQRRDASSSRARRSGRGPTASGPPAALPSAKSWSSSSPQGLSSATSSSPNSSAAKLQSREGQRVRGDAAAGGGGSGGGKGDGARAAAACSYSAPVMRALQRPLRQQRGARAHAGGPQAFPLTRWRHLRRNPRHRPPLCCRRQENGRQALEKRATAGEVERGRRAGWAGSCTNVESRRRKRRKTRHR